MDQPLVKPLTVAELAEHLGISESWIRHRCAARAIPFTKVARQIRFTQAHVEQIVAAGEQPVVRSVAAVVSIRSRRRSA